MAKQAGQLVIASARAPFVRGEDGISRAPGGLVSALLPLMQRVRGTWVAAGSEHGAEDVGDASFRVTPVSIPPSTRALWYSGASNAGLWPLAHGFLERCRFRRDEASAYLDVNQRVADAIATSARTRSVVWVHDYQLALVPALLRARRKDVTIGFFWHIPWPGADVFRVLPWGKELVQGLLGANLVAFHVPRYVDAFAHTLRELNIAFDFDDEGLVVPSRESNAHIIACPIGIDAAAWASLGTDPDVAARAAKLRADLGGTRILLSIDRIDYAKGIVERLEAFERLLERSAYAREHVTFVQIAVPSRESVSAYRQLRERVESIVGRISGRFGSPTRRPVHLFARSYESEELAAFYVASDVAIVTPMRDGMNLVAFEYVATRPTPSGRLLLSEMAGAADVLMGAWRVNPYDADGFEAAIADAAMLPETAKDTERMRSLKRVVNDVSLDHWISNFLMNLEASTAITSSDPARRHVASRVHRSDVTSRSTWSAALWMDRMDSRETSENSRESR